MFQDANLAAMAEALSRSPDYRVLRRLMPRLPSAPSVGQKLRAAVLLDAETTGLDARKDEIIELGMVKFDYLPDGALPASGAYSPPSTNRPRRSPTR